MADWLEFRAYAAADGNASAEDLKRALVALGYDRSGGASDEVLAAAAFAEIADRAAACDAAYPFQVTGGALQFRATPEIHWPYLFCQLLSLRGADRGEAEVAPTEIFEDLAEIAGRRYTSGKSMKFGFPRRVMPAGFMAALEVVCKTLKEGTGARARPNSATAKDARLDLVAWRPFRDELPGQMILFGQCAAGGNWSEKLTDLQPNNFTDLYFLEAPAVYPVRGFFTPFRLSRADWYMNAKHGGILFDRCRIADLVHGEPPLPRVLEWCQDTRRQLEAAPAAQPRRRPRRRRTRAAAAGARARPRRRAQAAA